MNSQPKKNNINAIRGMKDFLPDDISVWQRIETSVENVTGSFGYREIRTPILEKTDLFKRSIGEATDIVEKEMYTLLDNNGESITLRPEATASCVRACNEHGLFYNQTQRLWYSGPMFRYERPQRGRYRQFHQFGIEAFGWPDNDIEAEVILLGETLWNNLGIKNLSLEINTLGSLESRKGYRDSLYQYLSAYKNELDIDSQKRLERNPMRILDSKNIKTQEILSDGPVIYDYLNKEELERFDNLKELLSLINVKYRLNNKLVRGLDYYTGLVFEWTTDELGAQNAVAAGGRYDGLSEQIGGQSMPAVGFACGLERLSELLLAKNHDQKFAKVDVYIINLGELAEKKGLTFSKTLRQKGLNVINNCGKGALKRQIKRADNSQALIALIIGEENVTEETIIIKPLRGQGDQITISDTESIEKIMQIVNYI